MPQTRPILFTIPTLYHPDGGIRGGAERYVFELARHLAHHVPVELVSFGPANVEKLGNLTIRLLPPTLVRGQSFNPISPRLLPRVLGSRLVHCFQKHVMTSSLTAIAGRITGRRVYVTDLGGGGWDLSAYVSTAGWFRGELHISRYSQSLGTTHPNAIIGGGVDGEKFSPGPGREGNEFLFVGRLYPHKGVDTLIEAADERTPIHIVGTAPDPTYLAHLRKLAQGKPVRFTLSATDEELVTHYRSATAIVLPSRLTDCFGKRTEVAELLGQTLLEGMASGLPGIGSRVASIPEIIEPGSTGFLFPEGDAQALRGLLHQLIDQPQLAQEMGRTARARVLEEFSWETVVDRCLTAYGVSQ